MFILKQDYCFPDTDVEPHSSEMIDHPLASPETEIPSTSIPVPDDNRIVRDVQNNPIKQVQ